MNCIFCHQTVLVNERFNGDATSNCLNCKISYFMYYAFNEAYIENIYFFAHRIAIRPIAQEIKIFGQSIIEIPHLYWLTPDNIGAWLQRINNMKAFL